MCSTELTWGVKKGARHVGIVADTPRTRGSPPVVAIEHNCARDSFEQDHPRAKDAQPAHRQRWDVRGTSRRVGWVAPESSAR